MKSETARFRNDLLELNKVDYGDFMRAANGYLIELRDSLTIVGDISIGRRLDRMQLYLQFDPSWQVDSTTKKLLGDTQYIDDLLQGHKQDWESDPERLRFVKPRKLPFQQD